jgi:3-methylfumaryl-CoA hydratase
MSGFEEWIGRTASSAERIDRWPLAGLCAALDNPATPGEGDEILPLAHWLYFPPGAPQSRLGTDGHPLRGDFLPPIPQPRRMWAGSKITFEQPIHLGNLVRKTAKIADITEKTGKSGRLIFVTVENIYEIECRCALTETQSLVYRDDPAPGEAPPPAQAAPSSPAWSVRHEPDPALLFRYSAVTFNAHRIHYDVPYARDMEGYPGIIVHGQLTATLMLHACLHANPERRPVNFSFRAMKPLFSGAPFFVEGAAGEEDGTYKLWARNAQGDLSMTADLKTV